DLLQRQLIWIILVLMSDIIISDDAPTTNIYTLSLHDALPIYTANVDQHDAGLLRLDQGEVRHVPSHLVHSRQAGALEILAAERRSEEHTSELQSREKLVCRLLLAKKKIIEMPI